MEPPIPITFEQIRERAYELWERNHRPEGLEIRFWLLAERDRKRSEAAGGIAEAPPGETSGEAGISEETALPERLRKSAAH